MKYIIKAVLLVSISTLASFNSYAGDYSRHSGLSINLGNHHNGISLSFKSPIKHRYNNHHYDNHDAYKAKHHYKHKRDHSKKQYKKYRKNTVLGYNKPYRYENKRNNYYYQPKHKQHNYYQRESAHHIKHYRQHKRSCHPVSKVVSDPHGRYRDLGGTMCYDRSGHAYIVPGSRYRIR
jgi:hypothetical protein